jgi:hypothetical protein
MIGSPSDRSPSPYAPTPELWLEAGFVIPTNPIHKPVATRRRLLDIIKTCHGSRLQQEQLTRSTDPKYVQKMAEELLATCNGLVEASLDKFGNYYVQALVQVVDERTVLRIASVLTSDQLVTEQVSKPITFCDLCTHSYGSHVVQVLIGRGSTSKALSVKLMDAFLSNIAKISVDFLGSICIVQALQKLVGVSKLVAGIAQFTRSLSQARHGHCVIIEALNHASSQTLGIMERELICGDIDQMVSNDFSFRAIVHALEMEKAGKVSDKHSRVRLVISNVNYNQKCFRLIDYLLRNFADHEAVQEDLIPRVIEIVQLGYVP